MHQRCPKCCSGDIHGVTVQTVEPLASCSHKLLQVRCRKSKLEAAGGKLVGPLGCKVIGEYTYPQTDRLKYIYMYK